MPHNYGGQIMAKKTKFFWGTTVRDGVTLKFLLLVLLCGIISVECMAEKKSAKPKKPEYGAIVFPRKGIINFEEGSFEIWLKSTYNTAEAMFGGGSGRSPITMMQTFQQNPSPKRGETSQSETKMEPASLIIIVGHMAASHGYLHFKGRMFDAFMGTKPEERLRRAVEVNPPKFDFKKDEWHFVAATWKKVGQEYECSFYIDDTFKAKVNVLADVEGVDMDPDNTYFCVGEYKDCNMGVDSFRVSKRVRTEEEILESFKSGLKTDESTLLFHNGSSLEKLRKTSEWPNPFKCNPKGEIFGAYKMEKGKFGKAILLHVPNMSK